MPSCRTRYIGRTLAIISEEMSVNRLVSPSAQTVALTAGSQRRDESGACRVRGHVAQAEQLRCVRERRPVQSIAYMCAPVCIPTDRKGAATAEVSKVAAPG